MVPESRRPSLADLTRAAINKQQRLAKAKAEQVRECDDFYRG